MTWRIALFDLDGTISDPFEGIFKSINHALVESGYEPARPEQVRKMIGPPLTDIFESLLGPLDERPMRVLIDCYRDRYATIGYTENVIYEEMPGIVKALYENGYRMGVCTSKRADYAAKIIEMFGLSRFFEFVDGGDIHIRKYMQIERLVANGIKATETIMIGDRAVDIEAARKNNVASAGVIWGFGDRAELENAGPDYIVESPRELLELLT
ncbi:MAG: HAD-IA family hydrolase [Gammaproteobacteria bacterium]|nr:HAD-IA family hydrolase [Gammaproteobacteria bacterium]